MTLGRNNLYLSIFSACLMGYIWLYFVISQQIEKGTIEVCLIKHITNIPCPSCGSTRSLVSLLQGDFSRALAINPLGYVIGSIMFVAPIWVSFDVITKNKTLFDFYQRTEKRLLKPVYAVPLILFLMVNWVWNIIKGL